MTHASICILSYNRPEFLTRCIQSIHHTVDEPVEIIVHDDGSRVGGDCSNGPREILERFLQEGLVSTVISNPPGHNQGQGVALNRMFRMATGDPIIKCDQDMIFRAGWLAECRRILRTDPRVGLLGVFKYEHDPVDWRKTRRPAPLWHEPPRDTGGLHVGYDFHTHICGSVMVIPRQVWRFLGPFDEHSDAFAEDAMMQKAVNESGKWACALPDNDLADNHGFGIGPSTVVEEGYVVHRIHHGPRLV